VTTITGIHQTEGMEVDMPETSSGGSFLQKPGAMAISHTTTTTTTMTASTTTATTTVTTATGTTPSVPEERPKKRKRSSLELQGSAIQQSFVQQELQKIIARYEELYAIFGEQLHPFLCAASTSSSTNSTHPKRSGDDDQGDLNTVRIEGNDYLLPMDDNDSLLSRTELQMF